MVTTIIYQRTVLGMASSTPFLTATVNGCQASNPGWPSHWVRIVQPLFGCPACRLEDAVLLVLHWYKHTGHGPSLTAVSRTFLWRFIQPFFSVLIYLHIHTDLVSWPWPLDSVWSIWKTRGKTLFLLLGLLSLYLYPNSTRKWTVVNQIRASIRFNNKA